MCLGSRNSAPTFTQESMHFSCMSNVETMPTVSVHCGSFFTLSFHLGLRFRFSLMSLSRCTLSVSRLCCLGHRSAVRVRKVPVDLPPVVDIGHAVVTSQAVVGGGGAAFLVAHPSRGEDARTELGICKHDDDYEGCLEKGKRQEMGSGRSNSLYRLAMRCRNL